MTRRRVAAVPLLAGLLALLPAPAAVAASAGTGTSQSSASAPSAQSLQATSAAVSKSLGAAHGKVTAYAAMGDGTLLYSSGGDRLLPPASTTKLYSVGTALLVLGASHQFVTRVASTGDEVGPDGVLHGDLVLVAGGDPTLRRRDLVSLAGAVARAGIDKVDGDVRLDDSLFDRQRGGAGWRREYVGEESGPLSALMVDNNLWRSDKAFRHNPSPANLDAFRRALSTAHVQVTGHSVVGPSSSPLTADLASHRSPALRLIARSVLQRSDNTMAEVLLKDVGATAMGLGSTAAGLAEVRAQARALGVPEPSGLRDGSGLSTRDLITSKALVAWLRALDGTAIGSALEAALPVSCRSGTLQHRLCTAGMAGRVSAKTGTLDYTSALAGWARAASGRVIVFSLVVSGRPYGVDRVALDNAVTSLVSGL